MDPLDPEVVARYERFRRIVQEHPVQVLLGDALEEAERTFREYVVLPDEAYVVLALWTTHTFFFQSRFCTPYVSLHSATLREGKTRTMEVAEALVVRPIITANISTAALYRMVNDERPTLFIDEHDATARVTQDYRRILNSGYRANGFVVRSVNGHAVRFSTYCPKMFAGIGYMPDTIRDRSIEIRMKRALPEEQDLLSRFHTNKVMQQQEAHRDMLQALANRYGQVIGDAEPIVPDAITNARSVEIWEPLWALADLAEGRWPESSRDIAVAMQQATPRDEKVALLADIRSVFGTRERVSSSEIVSFVDERRGVYEGLPIRNGKQLGLMLRPFEIAPKRMRLPSGENLHGYERADFDDAWRRYL